MPAGVPLHTAGAFPLFFRFRILYYSSSPLKHPESNTVSEIRSPDQCKLQWCLHMSVTIQVEHLLLLFAGFAWTMILICLNRLSKVSCVFFFFLAFFLSSTCRFLPFRSLSADCGCVFCLFGGFFIVSFPYILICYIKYTFLSGGEVHYKGLWLFDLSRHVFYFCCC